MATFDNSWLLSEFNRYTGRTSTTDSMSDADKYSRLTNGQQRVVQEMYAVVPNSLYPHANSLSTMTSVNNGNIFTFGADSNGYAIAPMGKTRIFDNPASFPQYAWVEGWDYVNEGTQVRLTNNRTWTAPLYWYGISPPADITASVQPALFPAAFRDLIVYQAVMNYAEEGTRNAPLADRMLRMWSLRWPQACLAWKTQFSDGGALGLTGLKLTEAGFNTNAYSSRVG